MKCMILGAGSGLPHPDFHLSSIIFQTNGSNILVDCGEGISKQLLRHGFSGDFIDAVLISHYHPDHVSGIFMLLQMLYLEGRTKPLRIFLPERTAALLDAMHLMYTFEQRFPFILSVDLVKDIGLHYANISTALTDHLQGYAGHINKNKLPNLMQSYCFLFTEADKTLVYTSDITSFEGIGHLLEKADIIIVDAMHPKAEIIISMRELPAKQIILTHGIGSKLNRWLISNPDSRFELAQENLMYQF